MFVTFCKTSEKVLHSLALVLTFNNLANEPLQTTTTLYGAMYLTYGSATKHNKVRDELHIVIKVT